MSPLPPSVPKFVNVGRNQPFVLAYEVLVAEFVVAMSVLKFGNNAVLITVGQSCMAVRAVLGHV